jgi:hypothetical protein
VIYISAEKFVLVARHLERLGGGKCEWVLVGSCGNSLIAFREGRE